MSGIETLGGTHRGYKTPRDRTQHWCGIETASSGMSLSKTCVTCDSRVVPHRSTVQAHSCLTSEFGWDPVLSARYERTMEVNIQHPRKQSGEELKPRTAWDRHPLITASQPLVCRDRNPRTWRTRWDRNPRDRQQIGGIETQHHQGSKPRTWWFPRCCHCPVGTPGRMESNPLWGSGIETQGVQGKVQYWGSNGHRGR